jgi:hypothetical protein
MGLAWQFLVKPSTPRLNIEHRYERQESRLANLTLLLIS